MSRTRASRARLLLFAALLTLAGSAGAATDSTPGISGSLREKVRLCESCHGDGGNSRTAGMPSIAGQPKIFLETQLVLFREGVRVSPQMQPVSKDLGDRDISSIAGIFTASPVRAESAATDASIEKRGRAAALTLRCGTCHLPDFRGRAQMPRLASQREDYLIESMLAFRDNRRVGADTMMAGVLHGVSDADIRAMAHFLSRAR